MKKIIFLACLVVLLMTTSIWLQHTAKENGKERFKDFYTFEINTQVESVRIAYKGNEIN
jgi:hypothetical protein